MQGSPHFLSTLPPGPGHRRAAWAVVLLSAAVFLALAPFAGKPLPPVPAFLPAYQSALILTDLLTMVVLLGQHAMLGSRALLALACAYLFSALMALAHALSFPGLFAPGGVLRAGVQTTAWLYFFWHAGFPLFIAAYVLAKRPPGPAVPGGGRPAVMLAALALTFLSATVLVVLATVGESLLPAIMVGQSDAPLKVGVAVVTWLVGIAVIGLLWHRRPHSLLDLWLMVALCAWSADNALAAVFNHARYDVGWYAGRVYGLLASGFVLEVLLLEYGALYGQLVRAHEAERRRGEELQELSTKLQSANRHLDAFAGNVAHDLRQPVTTIAAFAQVLGERLSTQLQPAEATYLRRIGEAAAQAHRMIQGLLEFARLGERPVAVAPVDLNQVLEQARTALAGEIESRPVKLEVEPLPMVNGDEGLVQLAVVNLLSNALKYSRGREQSCISVEAAADGRGLRIRDNGVGFDMAAAHKLFAPFQRLHSAREFEGTGLGLANVRRIMERHGGSVRAESAPGEGATFTLVFPA